MPLVKTLLVIGAGAVTLPLLYDVSLRAAGRPALGLQALGWEAAVVFVIGCALVFPVARSRWHGWRLMLAVFILVAGVNAFLVVFEMLTFTEPGEGIGALLFWWVCRAAGLSALVVTSLRRWQPRQGLQTEAVVPRFSIGGWVWRIVVSVVSYTALFMIAGLLVMRLDAVPDYTSPEYASAPTTESAATDDRSSEGTAANSTIYVPAPSVVFGFIFVRGLACIALSLPLVRSLIGGRWTAGLAVGLALAVLGGVAPLLAPNPEMTTGARYAHMLEIGWSNLAYGLVIGGLFGNRKPETGSCASNPGPPWGKHVI